MSIESKLREYAAKLGGNVSLNRLFPRSFVQRHSQFESIESLFSQAGIINQESFDAWHDSVGADSYISSKTDFDSWNEMLASAAKEFAKTKQIMLREGTWTDETFDSGILFDDIHIFLNFSPV